MVQWFRLLLPMQGVGVPSVVGELRSYMPPDQKKINNKTLKHRSKIVTNSKDLIFFFFNGGWRGTANTKVLKCDFVFKEQRGERRE